MFIERILLTASFVIHACVHLTVHQVQAKKSSPESKDNKALKDFEYGADSHGFLDSTNQDSQCEPGWQYYNSNCYLFVSQHTKFADAQENCYQNRAYLADITSKDENDYIKAVLDSVHAKEGTDYLIGGMEVMINEQFLWTTGSPMTFTDWRADQKAPSAIRPYILLDSAHGFQWNARDDTDSNNNGYICKKTLEFSIKSNVTSSAEKTGKGKMAKGLLRNLSNATSPVEKAGKGKMEKGLLRLRNKVQKAFMGLSAQEIEEFLDFLPSTALQVDNNECQAKNTGDLQEHHNLTNSYRQFNFGNTRRPGVKRLDRFAVYRALEEGRNVAVEPQCPAGWNYYNAHCYLFVSQHTKFADAHKNCQQHGASLADITNAAENDYIKNVLKAVQAKDGTDYFIGGVDAARNKQFKWLNGQPVTFSDWSANQNEPSGIRPYIHMDAADGFAWNTRSDVDDTDNGYVCKKKFDFGPVVSQRLFRQQGNRGARRPMRRRRPGRRQNGFRRPGGRGRPGGRRRRFGGRGGGDRRRRRQGGRGNNRRRDRSDDSEDYDSKTDDYDNNSDSDSASDSSE